ncbi:hypothetical protein [Brucella intermedia]|uniref:hypothetical protein n=1 Tax=Brucella intermedia TaxID=94625 RepID=UPI00130EB06D|nr:hypothetical protein [Brucella intermedia]WGG59456.1 hypothetical protein QA414_00545 [Brucella intermedia]
MRTNGLIPAILLACGTVAVGPANAQVYDTDFSAMIMNQNLGTLNTYNNNMNRLDAERRELDRRRTRNSEVSAHSSGIPDYIVDRTQGAVLARLNPEYKRRAAAYGKANADKWMVAAARNIGQQVGALGKEYLTRVQRQGRNKADTWYVARASEIGRQYVAGSAN